MKHLNFWQKLDVPEKELEKDRKLDREIGESKVHFGSDKTRKQFAKSDRDCFSAHEKLNFAQVVGPDPFTDIAALNQEFIERSRKKQIAIDGHYREIRLKEAERESCLNLTRRRLRS